MSDTTLRIFTDGGSRGNPGPAAIGVVIWNENQVIGEVSQFLGTKTNNDAEYEAFLASLKWLEDFLSTHQVARVEWRLDSKLVVEQLSKNWKIKEERIRLYAQQAWQKLQTLNVPYSITHVPREQNKEADALVNQALDAALK